MAQSMLKYPLTRIMAYSDGEKAEALIRLAVNKYDFDLTAEQTGIAARTLRRWDKNVTKKSVGELLDRAIERMLMAIPREWSGHDWAIALGILIDKWLIMQGEPTVRSESIVHGYSELDETEKELVAERVRAFLGIDGANPESNIGERSSNRSDPA